MINQLTQKEAQDLFDYRDGMLYWRRMATGRRGDLRAPTVSGKRAEINIGGTRYQAHYVVWNWHNGVTPNRLRVRDGNRLNIDIENIEEVKVFIPARSPHLSNTCPCCNSRVPVPTLEMIAYQCDLTPREHKIVQVLWNKKGLPVLPPQIFTVMYEDDHDGGPSNATMYRDFKVALSHTRKKLIGSGVSIVSMGSRQGYRLTIGG